MSIKIDSTGKLEAQLNNIVQQVKAIKVVTQAEYDVLSEAKLIDNTLYIIKG